jgi:uncharacterized protein
LNLFSGLTLIDFDYIHQIIESQSTKSIFVSMIIEEIYIYPVKGCAGIRLEQVSLDDYGLLNDRLYQLVDADHRFMSQRTTPKMSQIIASIKDKQLILHYPGLEDLNIRDVFTTQTLNVSIWEDEVEADDVGDQAADWFSTALGTKARLVKIGTSYNRNVRLGDKTLPNQVHFGDSQPILVISKESLNDLNARLEVPVGMDRFRPNIVISGVNAYDEDRFTEIEMNTVKLHFTKKCARCTVTTIDQKTSISGPEPLKTLSTYRKEGSKVYFGAYYLAETKGSIKVGEQIRIR